MDAGIAGLLANSTRAKDCLPVINEEVSAEIPFGVMVQQGTGDAGVLKLTASDNVFAGVSVFSHSLARDLEVGDTGVKSGIDFSILNKGCVYVLVEEAVTPASRPIVRAIATTGETAGAFRDTHAGDALVYADDTFTAAATDIVTNVAHGLLTGDGPFQLTSSGTLPAGLALATDYWIIKIDADTFYFATSLANSLIGTRVDITDAGTGTHTISDTAGTLRNATVDIGDYAKYLTSAGAGEFAILELNMRVSRAVDAV